VRKPDQSSLPDTLSTDADELDYYAFVQWIADQQLSACRTKAQDAGLPIGLILMLRVGVRADGSTPGATRISFCRRSRSALRPDQLNTEGRAGALPGSIRSV